MILQRSSYSAGIGRNCPITTEGKSKTYNQLNTRCAWAIEDENQVIKVIEGKLIGVG
jgi:aspartate/methionine/tyrosine aminotransferase